MSSYLRKVPCPNSGKTMRKIRAGPSDYANGTGFTITCPEFRTVSSAVITANPENLVADNDTGYATKYTISGTTITIKCYTLATGGGGQAWAEVVNHEDLSTITFIADVLGY